MTSIISPHDGSILLLIAPCVALRTFEPYPPVGLTRNNVIEGYLDVRLNHFKAYNNETMRMRYYYNDEFADEDIVIFVGGEWSISPGWVMGGLAHDLAKKLNAGLFYTEHRYYGLSRAPGDTSTEDLRYLTVDQALGDLAQFIQYVKSDRFYEGRHKNGRVALVGCSYAGSMATWMRLAYPHLIDAVFSDSGPLHAQEDFPEYLEVIAEAIRVQGSEQCLTSIEEGVTQLGALLATPTGPEQVSQMFRTCAPITLSPLDLATFYWFGITETFAYLVQYAIPGDIPAACAVLTNPSVASPVQRLANWITSQPWTEPCIESRYAVMVDGHSNTSYDAPATTMRLWTYQTCVEYGWYQTTTSDRQPFLSTIPLEYFHQMCRSFFDNRLDENLLRSGIERTNLLFAGLTHLPEKVVSVVGGHDPWSPMGPNATHAHRLAPVYVVPGVSHCRAIRPLGESAEQELEDVKMSVLLRMEEFVTGIVRDPEPPSSATHRYLTSTLFILTVILTFI